MSEYLIAGPDKEADALMAYVTAKADELIRNYWDTVTEDVITERASMELALPMWCAERLVNGGSFMGWPTVRAEVDEPQWRIVPDNCAICAPSTSGLA